MCVQRICKLTLCRCDEIVWVVENTHTNTHTLHKEPEFTHNADDKSCEVLRVGRASCSALEVIGVERFLAPLAVGFEYHVSNDVMLSVLVGYCRVKRNVSVKMCDKTIIR